MALFFSPPTAPLVPAAVKASHPGYSLMRHYRNYDAGINIFVVDGAVTTVEPDYEFVTPDRVYLGGHIYPVTADEAQLLIDAGYTVHEGGAPVLEVGLPGGGLGSDFRPGFGTGLYGGGPYGGVEVDNTGLPGTDFGSDYTSGIGIDAFGISPFGGIA